MLANFVHSGFSKLEDYKKGITGIEQAHSIRSPDDKRHARDTMRLDQLQSTEKALILSHISRLAEGMMNLASQSSQGEVEFDSTSEEQAKGRQASMYNQAFFWSFVRQIVDYKQEGFKKLDKISYQHLSQSNMPLSNFIADFNYLYKNHSRAIFLENDTSEMEKLRDKYRNFLDWEIIIESVDLMDYILVSDPQLMKVHWILKSFQTTSHIERDEIKSMESRLNSLLIQAGSDMKGIFDSGRDPTIISLFLEILQLKIKSSNSLDSACDYLRAFSFHDLELTIRGLVPYHARDALKDHCGIPIGDMFLPDIMTYKEGHSESNPGNGNQNWLVMLRSLQEFTETSTEVAKKKIISFLASDYKEQDSYLKKPLEKLHNILRVRSAD